MTKKLRKLDAATAPVGEHADPEVRFLHLYVSPIGSRTWRVRLRSPGERAKRHTLGHWPEMTHEQARQAALISRAAIRRNADPQAVLASRQPRTIGEAIEEFIKSPMALRKAKVTDVYRKVMATNLRPPKKAKDHLAGLRSMEIATVRRRDIAALMDTAPLEILRKLRVFFSWAQRKEYVEHSPFSGIKLPQNGKDTRALIANNEGGIDWRELVAVLRGIEKFVEERPDNPWPHAYRLQLFTATRPEEVTRLRWEDADIESEYPTLWVDGKTGRRQLPLTRAAVKVLQQVQPDPDKRHGWIFPTDRTPGGHLTAAPEAHRRIVKLAGTKKRWNRKHLRKTVRTWFGAQRQDVLGRLALGHSLIGMDAHYDGSDPLPLVRKGMNAFCDAVEAAMNPPAPASKKVTPLRRAA
jgi:integrase